jgi:hypothetical protein
MKANIQIKASILSAMMSEDRQEVRSLRSSIYNLVSLLTISSFALTSYLLDKQPVTNPTNICQLADTLILVFLWVFFARYKTDLHHCRQCLKLRQDLIRNLDEDDTGSLDPFPDASKVVPDIRDTELWWLPILATVGIGTKMIVLWQSTGV